MSALGEELPLMDSGITAMRHLQYQVTQESSAWNSQYWDMDVRRVLGKLIERATKIFKLEAQPSVYKVHSLALLVAGNIYEGSYVWLLGLREQDLELVKSGGAHLDIVRKNINKLTKVIENFCNDHNPKRFSWYDLYSA